MYQDSYVRFIALFTFSAVLGRFSGLVVQVVSRWVTLRSGNGTQVKLCA